MAKFLFFLFGLMAIDGFLFFGVGGNEGWRVRLLSWLELVVFFGGVERGEHNGRIRIIREL